MRWLDVMVHINSCIKYPCELGQEIGLIWRAGTRSALASGSSLSSQEAPLCPQNETPESRTHSPEKGADTESMISHAHSSQVRLARISLSCSPLTLLKSAFF